MPSQMGSAWIPGRPNTASAPSASRDSTTTWPPMRVPVREVIGPNIAPSDQRGRVAPASPPLEERVNAYAGLLASPNVRRLIFASTIARLPAAMLPLAILLLVVETSGSIAAGGL